MLHGARWLLNKDIVRGANSYPLKGIVGARTERAPIPLSILETRGRTNKDQGYDVDKRRETGSEIIGSGITTGSDASKQTIFLARGQRRAQREAGGGGRRRKSGGVVVIGSKENTY